MKFLVLLLLLFSSLHQLSCKTSRINSKVSQNTLANPIEGINIEGKIDLRPLTNLCTPSSFSNAWNQSKFFEHLREFFKKQRWVFRGVKESELKEDIRLFLLEYRKEERQQVLTALADQWDILEGGFESFFATHSDFENRALKYALPAVFVRMGMPSENFLSEEKFSFPSGIHETQAKKALAVLLSLNFNHEYVMKQYLVLEYLLVKMKVKPRKLLQFIKSYQNKNGFNFIGPLPSLEVDEFINFLADGSYWREDYKQAETNYFQKKIWPTYLKKYGSIKEAINQMYWGERTVPIGHGVYSHFFQLFVQSRVLEDCNLSNTFPKPILKGLRTVPKLNYTVSTPYSIETNDAWLSFWRSTNDGFASTPNFSSAHFNSLMLLIAAPKLSEINSSRKNY